MPLLKPLSWEEREQMRRRFSHDEQMALIREYAELRTLLADPLASMRVAVLQPMCQSCLRPWPEADDPPVRYDVPIHATRENTYLYPALDRPARTYLAEYGLMVFRKEPKWEIRCFFCHEVVGESSMFHVVEESFQKFFCLDDQPKGLPKWLRRHILEVYGSRCFNCGEPLSATTLTIDHIIPKSKGGDSRPSNLQPLCATCNNQLKNNADSSAHYIFLDFLTRRPPSDAFSDLIY